MIPIADFLADDLFFAGLPAKSIDAVASCGGEVHFDTDQLVIAEDAPADHFYVLRNGKVAIEIDTPRKGSQTIETVGPGQLLGVSWLVPPHRWTFGARAIEPTHAIAIDSACLRQKCEADHDLGYELLLRFSVLVRNRLQATRLLLLDMYGSHAS